MRGYLAHLTILFERRAKMSIVVAIVGSIVTAVLDGLAIGLILPLINLATDKHADTAVLRALRSLLGHPGVESLTVSLSIAVVILFVLKDLGSLWFLWWMNGFINTERVRTSARILSHMLSAPYSQVSARTSPELMRTADTSVMQVFNFTVNGLITTVSNGFAVAAILVVLVVLAPIPTVVLAAYFALAVFIFVRLSRPKARRAGVRLSQSSLAGFKTALAALGAIKEIKLRGTQQHFVDNYRNAQLDGAYAGRTAGFLAALPKYVLEILFVLAIGIVVGVSAGSGGSIVGLLALFVAAGFRLLPAVSALLASVSSIGIGKDSLDIVLVEVLAAREAAAPEAGSRSPEPSSSEGRSEFGFDRELRIEGVSFRYPTGTVDVVDDVWLSVPRGSSLALVGDSGAGKTTLVDIVLGLHTPSRGRIVVDGVDVATDLVGWQRRVGYVEQDVYLLDASLAENVAFDQRPEDIDLDRVASAVEQAQLADVVAGLPDGVNTQVGERGARLSGGQRQRIGIARALYREPDLLVLDEATSALDNETERRVSDTISGLHGDVTVVVIAHRLSTVRHVDQVAFLNRGTVENTGTFDEVRAANPLFARLAELGSLGPLPAAPSEMLDEHA